MVKSKVEVKELKPKSEDLKFVGTEPIFVEGKEYGDPKWALVKAFNWYNHFYDQKEAKELLAGYLEYKDRSAHAKLIRKVSDNQVNKTIVWLARVTLRGWKATEQQEKDINNEIDRLLAIVKKEDKPEEEIKESNRPNVQEIMRERTLEAGGELEGMLDEYLASGAKKDFKLKVTEEFKSRNILPQHMGLLIDPWQDYKKEFEQVLNGKDEQLNEAYSRFSKPQLKNILKFIEQVLMDMNNYVSLKKSARAPRKKKAVPVEKIVSKLKYLKEFKDPAIKLELVSLHPTKLYGASEAWCYDTVKRKLHHYVADEYGKTFTVKGNTLLGFDANQSEVKTLRKPNEQIKEIMGSKPAARKFFDSIKAVAVKPNGRFNAGMIILRAF